MKLDIQSNFNFIKAAENDIEMLAKGIEHISLRLSLILSAPRSIELFLRKK